MAADDPMDPAKPARAKFPDFTREAEKCRRFLAEFEDASGRRRYMRILQRVANRRENVVKILMDDVLQFENDEEFAHNIERNTRRYVTMFCQAAEKLLPEPTVEFAETDVLDTLTEQRIQNVLQQGKSLEEAKALFPPELLRRFELRIIPRAIQKTLPLRSVRADHVGALVKVKGIVTKCTDVMPMMRVATYTCDMCGWELYQTIDSREYMPLRECESEVCKANKNKGLLFPQTRGSKFVKYQDLKLQELPGEVPVGSIPRGISATVQGELTRCAVPGDIVTLSGIFLVTRYTGYRAIRAGLTADTYLEAMEVENHKKSYSDYVITPEMEAEIEAKSKSGNVYTKLAKSIAPEIFGLDDVKKALLLLLVGGVTRKLSDGMKIRGDINILLMGDPGVAKSQLLKHIASLAPRGVYTTGKGSSGAGLTAAVIKDPVSGEMTLEGGALVLADMGVCCIDEFDKMEDHDRTVIHEVMEQQTVSIAKAGITTTLNARTAVLAAANPVYGRYNKRLTPEENIGLEAALLSRFDLTFVLLDTPDENVDLGLARHVTYVHRTLQPPPLAVETFTPQFLRGYIAKARSYEPHVPQDLTDTIVETYVELRNENTDLHSAGQHPQHRQRFCTARSLLSILRMSQALARLRFSKVVEEEDVVEASRLLYMAKAELLLDQLDEKAVSASKPTQIFEIIKSAAEAAKSDRIRRTDLERRATMKGFSTGDLDRCLEQYANLGVLQLTDAWVYLVK